MVQLVLGEEGGEEEEEGGEGGQAAGPAQVDLLLLHGIRRSKKFLSYGKFRNWSDRYSYGCK